MQRSNRFTAEEWQMRKKNLGQLGRIMGRLPLRYDTAVGDTIAKTISSNW